jgi:hypothetical protein
MNGMPTREEIQAWLTLLASWSDRIAVVNSYLRITPEEPSDSTMKTDLRSGREPGFKGNATEACRMESAEH